MFRKLVSNLPFYPTLIPQVVLYLQQLKNERKLRNFGIVLIIMVFGLQFFLYAYPSQNSLNSHVGDIVYGASTKEDILNAYSQNRDQAGRTDIKAIFDYYGIGQSQIETTDNVYIDNSSENKYISTSRVTSQFPDNFLYIPGALSGGIYEHPFETWSKEESPRDYPALTGISSFGFRYWILLNGGGNIIYEVGAKKANLEILKTRDSGGLQVSPGQEITYSIYFRNSGAINAESVVISDLLPKSLSYEDYTSSIDLVLTNNGQNISWQIDNENSTLPPSDKWYSIKLKVKVGTFDENSSTICNSASLSSAGTPIVSTPIQNKDTCSKNINPTCPGTGLPIPNGELNECVITCPDGSLSDFSKNCTTPQLVCSGLNNTFSQAWNKREYEIKTVSQPKATIKNINYYINDKKIDIGPFVKSSTVQNFNYTFPSPGTYKVKAEIIADNSGVQQSKNCEITEIIEKLPLTSTVLTTDKEVSNVTKGISNADNTKASPGDVLNYKIKISNNGNETVTTELNGEYADNIADIMEYADLTDKGTANYSKLTKTLSWEKESIKPGETIEKTFSVTVLKKLPITPASSPNPLSNDFRISNEYGRAVVVDLDKPISKIVEDFTTKLPLYSSRYILLFSFIVTTTAIYFNLRSRLLSKELKIIKDEFTSGSL